MKATFNSIKENLSKLCLKAQCQLFPYRSLILISAKVLFFTLIVPDITFAQEITPKRPTIGQGAISINFDYYIKPLIVDFLRVTSWVMIAYGVWRYTRGEEREGKDTAKKAIFGYFAIQLIDTGLYLIDVISENAIPKPDQLMIPPQTRGAG